MYMDKVTVAFGSECPLATLGRDQRELRRSALWMFA
jgi:hypothetical protein